MQKFLSNHDYIQHSMRMHHDVSQIAKKVENSHLLYKRECKFTSLSEEILGGCAYYHLSVLFFKYLVLGRDTFDFVKYHSDSNKQLSEADIIKMIDFLVENIFVTF